MQLFYLSAITPGVCELPTEEARHATQVLRKRVGDVLDVVDGKGGWYRAEIVAAGKRNCTLQCALVRQEEQRQPYRTILMVSPTKSNDRFEWFLEKATEIGVDEIVPLLCKRTERPRIRLDRYEKVLVSAMKQSLQAWLPQLHPLTPIGQALELYPSITQRYLGWCDDTTKVSLVRNYEAGQDVIIAIGPEGDFTAGEVDLAQSNGFRAVTFGTNRLRTETAAVYVAQAVAVLNGL